MSDTRIEELENDMIMATERMEELEHMLSAERDAHDKQVKRLVDALMKVVWVNYYPSMKHFYSLGQTAQVALALLAEYGRVTISEDGKTIRPVIEARK